MDSFIRILKIITNLLGALILFAGGFHFAYATQSLDRSQEVIQAQALPNKQITIVAQHFSSHYSTVAKSLSLSSLANDYLIVNMSLDDWKRLKPKSELTISLGSTALEELLKSKHQETILAALITFQEWKEITSSYQASKATSAIFYDPDPKRQILLGKLLLPLSKSIGVMHSMDTPYFMEGYQEIADALDLKLHSVKTKQATEVPQQFPALAQQADFIVLQPDPVIYNSQTLPRVLLSSYRQRKVIIGYSTGIVNAGSVATTYTTSEMLVDDLTESSLKLLSGESSQFTRYSQYYDIRYNTDVAHSLELEVVPKDQLQSEIEKLVLKLTPPTDSEG
jgi:hypothetical protein